MKTTTIWLFTKELEREKDFHVRPLFINLFCCAYQWVKCRYKMTTATNLQRSSWRDILIKMKRELFNQIKSSKIHRFITNEEFNWNPISLVNSFLLTFTENDLKKQVFILLWKWRKMHNYSQQQLIWIKLQILPKIMFIL